MIQLRTLLVTLTISSLLVLTGCALFEQQPEEPVVKGPVTKVIDAPYDEVWRALQKAVSKYPIQMNNIEQGTIETDVIKGDDRWVPPYKKRDQLPRYTYQMRFNLIRGKISGGESVKLLISKDISLDRDFFSGTERRQSDGLEERMIIYRVERELTLERATRKAFEKKQRF